jgi:hypothetical protein
MEWNCTDVLFETEKSALNHSSPTYVGALVTPADSIDNGNSTLPAMNVEPFSPLPHNHTTFNDFSPISYANEGRRVDSPKCHKSLPVDSQSIVDNMPLSGPIRTESAIAPQRFIDDRLEVFGKWTGRRPTHQLKVWQRLLIFVAGIEASLALSAGGTNRPIIGGMTFGKELYDRYFGNTQRGIIGYVSYWSTN